MCLGHFGAHTPPIYLSRAREKMMRIGKIGKYMYFIGLNYKDRGGICPNVPQRNLEAQ